MEGSTYWRYNGNNLLKDYMDDVGEDYSIIENGIENVLTSYYGYYYPLNNNTWATAHCAAQKNPENAGKSNLTPEERLAPYFMPTTVGMGVGDGGNDDYFGPELGMAYKLSQEYDGDEPIHLVKYAFSGSGFEKTDGPTWKARPDESKTDEENSKSSLYFLLKRYTDNCLKVIEDEGKIPVIKGLIWHQGESDTGNNNYQTQMEQLIEDFRNDYADYATDGDGANIAFLDCTIYDGSKNRYGSQESVNSGINAKKFAIAESENNYIVDGTFTDHGLKLEIGDTEKGGYNMYHYNTKDAFILGEAYADIILENGLLD